MIFTYVYIHDPTIKNRLYKWMNTNKTERYINSLEAILEGYNNAVHSSIGVSPNTAWNDRSTHPKIREKLQIYYDKFTKTKPRFRVGNIV